MMVGPWEDILFTGKNPKVLWMCSLSAFMSRKLSLAVVNATSTTNCDVDRPLYLRINSLRLHSLVCNDHTLKW